MKLVYGIIFFLAVVALVTCEYLLLKEITFNQRPPVIVSTVGGSLLSLVTVFISFRNSTRDLA